MRLLAHNDGHELRGNERQLLLLTRGLAARGHDVLVSCRAGAPLAHELAHARVDVSGVRPRGDLAFGSALAFRRLVAERRPDALLLTSWKRLSAAVWAARAQTPRIVARLGIVRGAPRRGWRAWAQRRALERVDALVVNSNAVRDAWIESAPWFPAERVHVIRNAVVTRPADAEPGGGLSAPRRRVATDVRRDLGLPPDVSLLLTVASLEPRKGIDLLLRALADLPADVHAAVAGDGPDADSLRSLGDALGLRGRVHWLGARGDVDALLAAADAFVLPTRRDSTPNAVLEAMAAGVPVVTTSGNGAEEAIGPADGRGPAGWIVGPEDPAGLVAAVQAVLADPVGTAARAVEARWRAAHWFGPGRMLDDYEGMLFGADRPSRRF